MKHCNKATGKRQKQLTLGKKQKTLRAVATKGKKSSTLKGNQQKNRSTSEGDENLELRPFAWLVDNPPLRKCHSPCARITIGIRPKSTFGTGKSATTCTSHRSCPISSTGSPKQGNSHESRNLPQKGGKLVAAEELSPSLHMLMAAKVEAYRHLQGSPKGSINMLG